MGNDRCLEYETHISKLTDWDFELEMEMLAFRLRDVIQLKPNFGTKVRGFILEIPRT